jgi:hypothetical protein
MAINASLRRYCETQISKTKCIEICKPNNPAKSGGYPRYPWFICFLQKTSILLAKDGRKRIDDNALVALTLMIAASKPSEKDIMIKVILNLLNEKKK